MVRAMCSNHTSSGVRFWTLAAGISTLHPKRAGNWMAQHKDTWERQFWRARPISFAVRNLAQNWLVKNA